MASWGFVSFCTHMPESFLILWWKKSNIGNIWWQIFFMLLISCHRSFWGFFCSWNFVTNTKYHWWIIPFSFQYFGTSWKNYRSLPIKLPLILAVSLFFREIITVSLSRRDNTTVLCIYSWVLYSSIIFLFKSIVSYSWLLSIYYIP